MYAIQFLFYNLLSPLLIYKILQNDYKTAVKLKHLSKLRSPVTSILSHSKHLELLSHLICYSQVTTLIPWYNYLWQSRLIFYNPVYLHLAFCQWIIFSRSRAFLLKKNNFSKNCIAYGFSQKCQLNKYIFLYTGKIST